MPKKLFTSKNQPKSLGKNGRPKGSRPMKDVINEIFATEIEFEDIHGKPKKCTVQHAINAAICKKAMKGDVQAFRALAERKEGMPKQEIDQVIREYLHKDFEGMSEKELQDEIIKLDKIIDDHKSGNATSETV